MKKVVKNKVAKCATIRFDRLSFISENLKKVKPLEFRKLKNSLTANGFIFPMLAYRAKSKVYLLDGVQRIHVLNELRDEGYSIDNVPIIYVKAKTLREATHYALLIKSHFAKVTKKGFDQFQKRVDLEAILDQINIPGLKLDEILEPMQTAVDTKVQFVYSEVQVTQVMELIEKLRKKFKQDDDNMLILDALRFVVGGKA